MTRSKAPSDRPGTPVPKGQTTGSKRQANGSQRAAMSAPETAGNGANAGEAAGRPSRLRLKLKTIDDVQAELARLYREGKARTRDVAEVSKLANVLGILARSIVDNDIEARLEAIEERQHGKK